MEFVLIFMVGIIVLVLLGALLPIAIDSSWKAAIEIYKTTGDIPTSLTLAALALFLAIVLIIVKIRTPEWLGIKDG
ncbi:MAG: hypothetical protein AABW63_02890 [Nanoarchaeota archaeon]|mgnify:CR=1 FL=1